MDQLAESVEEVARRSGFTGAVRVDDRSGFRLAAAYGLADRANGIANAVGTRFAMASGSKGFTALTIACLIEQGVLALDTTARSILGPDLPLIDDAVTVEHLLAHRSGIGDYLDEDDDLDFDDYLMPVPVHQLVTTGDYLPALTGHPTKFPPGERFSYSNGGYVVLALIAERTAGRPFAELVQELVCRPAGMRDTGFLRSDELPGRTAVGYLTADGLRSNIFHLPVLGSGDGGGYTTVSDMHDFWLALFAGRIVPPDRVAEMVRPRSAEPDKSKRYGLGFVLHSTSDVVSLGGCDSGVSFRSVHDPTNGLTHTVVSNWTDGAWPLTHHLDDVLGT